MPTTPSLGSASRVPANHGGRTLVLCFDGTWDSFDKDVSQLSSPSSQVVPEAECDLQNSNVVQFVAMLKKNDPTKQLVYYQVNFLSQCVKSTVLT